MINMIYAAVVAFILSYLLGSINTSIIVSKFYDKGDIRQKGSGNAGATNTLRVLGKKAAVFVVLGDALKGIIAVLLSYVIEKSIFGVYEGYAVYVAAVAVVLGHVFPVFFGFRGGKGIMTSIAVIFVLDSAIGGILFAVFAALVICFNYISLASCVCCIVYPLLVWWFHTGNIAFLASSVIVALIALIKHRTNIVRLFKGTESKFIKKKA